ncbi:MAG: hypothetical protein AAF228_13370 [Pseudomonadota bacterium]
MAVFALVRVIPELANAILFGGSSLKGDTMAYHFTRPAAAGYHMTQQISSPLQDRTSYQGANTSHPQPSESRQSFLQSEKTQSRVPHKTPPQNRQAQ